MIDLFDVLEKEIRPYLTGVPEFVSRPAMSSATYEFCDDSGAWTDDQILGAFDNDIPLYPSDPINSTVIGVQFVKQPNSNYRYPHIFREGKVVLGFVPNTNVVVRVKLANNRITDSLNVPDWFYGQHHKAITHLTVHKLMSMQNKPWYDPNGAAFHYGEYRKHMGDGVIKATPKMVKMRPFI
ncbi:TPA: hypothetical protein PEP05_000766 [Vibrio parahaemolyticus]|nr:hypothetical protein [Vibrio parahaemolyticus]